MREHTHKFRLGCPSVTGEYHVRCTEALINSLNSNSLRHAKVTNALMQKQIAHLNLVATNILASDAVTNIPMRNHMGFHLRVHQLLSIHTSKLHILLEHRECFTNKLDKIAALISNRRILFTIHDLVVGITEPLVSLGINNFQELLDPANDHYLITWDMFKVKFRNSWRQEHAHAMTCLHTLLNTPSDQDITPDVARQIFKSSKGFTPTDRTQVMRDPLTIPELIFAFAISRVAQFRRWRCTA